jgi:uncharacterized protein (TIGR02246 family)
MTRRNHRGIDADEPARELKHIIMNNRTLLIPTLDLFLATPASSSAQAPDQSEARSSITAANEQFMAALAKGDAGAIATAYSEEAQLLPPNAEVVRGREAIRKYWQGAIDAGIKGLQLRTQELHGLSGDMVAEVGAYTATGAGGKTLETGKYIVLWKRENGKWRLHRDMFSSNAPAAGKEQ